MSFNYFGSPLTAYPTPLTAPTYGTTFGTFPATTYGSYPFVNGGTYTTTGTWTSGATTLLPAATSLAGTTTFPTLSWPSATTTLPVASGWTLPTASTIPFSTPRGLLPTTLTPYPAPITTFPSTLLPTTIPFGFPTPVIQKPKVVYFNGRGRAELIRLIFAAAGVDFEDVRFKPNADNDTNPDRPNDDLMAFKATGDSITGQVPYVEIDGLKLSQSMAICRYLAARYGLQGDGTEKTKVYIDMIVDTVGDIRNKLVDAYMEKDPTRKAELNKAFAETIIPKYGEILQKFLDKNDIKTGYFVGGQLTWADLCVYDFWATLLKVLPEPTKPFEKLAAHAKLVESNPLVAAWIAKRPDTPF